MRGTFPVMCKTDCLWVAHRQHGQIYQRASLHQWLKPSATLRPRDSTERNPAYLGTRRWFDSLLYCTCHDNLSQIPLVKLVFQQRSAVPEQSLQASLHQPSTSPVVILLICRSLKPCIFVQGCKYHLCAAAPLGVKS